MVNYRAGRRLSLDHQIAHMKGANSFYISSFHFRAYFFAFPDDLHGVVNTCFLGNHQNVIKNKLVRYHRYPFYPPVVRFLTKIIHPNVSRHGDVGIDIIQHNWSYALSIYKVLLSVQSILTDPFTQVSTANWLLMEFPRCKIILVVLSRFVWNQSLGDYMKMTGHDLRH